MSRPRTRILVSGLILCLSLALGVQVYLLYDQLGEKDRTIRLLAAEVQRLSSVVAPLSGALDGQGDSLITLRYRLRERDKQVRLLEEEKQRRRLDLLAAEQESSKSGEALRDVREKLQAAQRSLLVLEGEKKKLEVEVGGLREARELAEARGRELTLLRQESARQARALEELQLQLDAARRAAARPKPPAEGKAPGSQPSP